MVAAKIFYNAAKLWYIWDHSLVMYYILYISAAATWMDNAGLQEILSVSRINNKRDHISGLLLYGGNNFIQLLEGEPGQVGEAFERIGKDIRHLDVTIIASGNIKGRCFPEWEMGFRSVHAEHRRSLDDFINQARQSYANNDCELPVRLMQSFVKKTGIAGH